ncbi:MAG: septation protein SepH [Actinomycetia bacterium]|nr:septation protein SepH [Actinomycetes bacterium]
MRLLRFVGPGEDRDHLVVETTDGKDKFSLLVNEELRAAVRADLPRLFDTEPETQPTISPREIQVRVRAGARPEDIAAEADVPLHRILVFARPVLDERAMVTAEARRGRARRGVPDGQLVEFGTTVDASFSINLIEPSMVRWDSRRREDGQWVVAATWRGDDLVEHCAEWSFSLSMRTVTPMNELAARLLTDLPIHLLTPTDIDATGGERFAADPPDPHDPVAIGLGSPSPTLPGPAPTEPASLPSYDLPGGFEPPVKRPAPDDRAARQRTGTGRVAPDRHPLGLNPIEQTMPLPAVLDDGPFPGAGPGPAPLLRLAEPAGSEPARTGPALAPTGPAPVPPTAEPGTGEPTEPGAAPARVRGPGEDRRSGKPKVPAWDDIILGVRRKKD